jgi:hypothetical protein
VGDRNEDQFLGVLADVRLPERWARLVSTMPGALPVGGRGGVRRYDLELMLRQSYTHRLTFTLEIVVLGEGRQSCWYSVPLHQCISAIRPDIGAAVPAEYWFETGADARRGVEWLLELARDVAARTVEMSWSLV